MYLAAVAGWSVYFGAKNLMAYAQLCLVAEAIGRFVIYFCATAKPGQLFVPTSRQASSVMSFLWTGRH